MKTEPRALKIGDRLVGKEHPVFVIAEAGVNHNGSFDLALKLIDAASDAGADAVKFQTFRAEQVVTSAGKMADYQKRNIGKEDSQVEMLRKLELKEDWYPALIQRAKEKGIIFISTPHGGMESVDLLESYNVPAFKFGSGVFFFFFFFFYIPVFRDVGEGIFQIFLFINTHIKIEKDFLTPRTSHHR